MRQVRTGLTEGTIFNEERQIALGQVLWHVLGGGYPRRITLISEKDRARVLHRDGGKCAICGADAKSVEHIRTACNRTINLRSVCSSCAKTKQFGDAKFLEHSAQQLERIAERIVSPIALRACDDSASWDWRAFLHRRKRMMVDD